MVDFDLSEAFPRTSKKLRPLGAPFRLTAQGARNIRGAEFRIVVPTGPLGGGSTDRDVYTISFDGVTKEEFREPRDTPFEVVFGAADAIIVNTLGLPKKAFEGFISTLEWADRRFD